MIKDLLLLKGQSYKKISPRYTYTFAKEKEKEHTIAFPSLFYDHYRVPNVLKVLWSVLPNHLT